MPLQHRTCGISDISRRFSVSPAAASQMVEKMARSGLIQRRPDPEDRRVKRLLLTAKGRAIIEKGNRQRHRWLDEFLKTMGAGGRKKLAAAIATLGSAMQQLEDA